jgi:phage-related protein
MVQKFVAAMVAMVMLSTPVLAQFGLDEDLLVDANDVLTAERTQEFLDRVTVDGKVSLELAEREFALSSGEERTFWPVVIAFIAASIKASCENDWSYRDDDRCVGKCDGYGKKKDRKDK